MNRDRLGDFTRTAAALVRANDDHADDFAAWEREVSAGGGSMGA
jgi:hypothetical protein